MWLLHTFAPAAKCCDVPQMQLEHGKIYSNKNMFSNISEFKFEIALLLYKSKHNCISMFVCLLLHT